MRNARKTLVAWVFIVGIVACGGFLSAAILFKNPAALEENYAKVDFGMTFLDIKKLLGHPGDYSTAAREYRSGYWSSGLGTPEVWKNDRVRIIIFFDHKNEVANKVCDPVYQESLFEMVKRLFLK